MNEKNFSALEKMILVYFKESQQNHVPFIDRSTGLNEYVVVADKPRTEDGEPKTDIYALIENEIGESREIKISVKKKNADFLENKTNAKRAEEILGENWRTIISDATKKIQEKFKNKYLVYFDEDGRTEKGSITLGWKFEILNKKSGELSGALDLTDEQKLDVYAGTNLPKEKRNAKVDGKVIEDSGVANCILVTDEDEIDDIQEVMDEIIPLSEFIEGSEGASLYFACKALNYRSLYNHNGKHGKYDGDRPLAVYVRWTAKDGKLIGELVFDEPLERGGKYSYEQLMKALTDLGVSSTNDLEEGQIQAKIYRKK